MNDIGVSCHKNSYGRTAGKVLGCENGLDEDAGLCYEPCNYGADGVGFVCWGHCPEGTTSCGGALCLVDGTSCSKHISGIIFDGLHSVASMVMGSPKGTFVNLSKLTKDFIYPECGGWYGESS